MKCIEKESEVFGSKNRNRWILKNNGKAKLSSKRLFNVYFPVTFLA
jgi:hypothetical protein